MPGAQRQEPAFLGAGHPRAYFLVSPGHDKVLLFEHAVNAVLVRHLARARLVYPLRAASTRVVVARASFHSLINNATL
jgi:hypothetical protein